VITEYSLRVYLIGGLARPGRWPGDGSWRRASQHRPRPSDLRWSRNV